VIRPPAWPAAGLECFQAIGVTSRSCVRSHPPTIRRAKTSGDTKSLDQPCPDTSKKHETQAWNVHHGTGAEPCRADRRLPSPQGTNYLRRTPANLMRTVAQRTAATHLARRSPDLTRRPTAIVPPITPMPNTELIRRGCSGHSGSGTAYAETGRRSHHAQKNKKV